MPRLRGSLGGISEPKPGIQNQNPAEKSFWQVDLVVGAYDNTASQWQAHLQSHCGRRLVLTRVIRLPSGKLLATPAREVVAGYLAKSLMEIYQWISYPAMVKIFRRVLRSQANVDRCCVA